MATDPALLRKKIDEFGLIARRNKLAATHEERSKRSVVALRNAALVAGLQAQMHELQERDATQKLEARQEAEQAARQRAEWRREAAALRKREAAAARRRRDDIHAQVAGQKRLVAACLVVCYVGASPELLCDHLLLTTRAGGGGAARAAAEAGRGTRARHRRAPAVSC